MMPGAATVAAGLSLAISGVCLAVFFTTDREAWGRANDATTALFALLMIPAVLEVGPPYATAIGVAGLLVIAVTSGLTSGGRLEWLLSAKIGGVGFAAFLLWIVAACTDVLRHGGFPDALAWLGLLTAALVGIALVVVIRFSRLHGTLFDEQEPSIGMWIPAVAAYLCLVTWTVWLGLAL